MRVDDLQVERSLAALRAEAASGGDAPRPRPRAVPTGLLERMASAPDMRLDLIRHVGDRLAAGEQPSPAVLAHHVVGRLVCERLR